MANAAAQAQTDREQLRLLAIFHYIVGGAAMLFSSFFSIHVAFGIALLAGLIPPGKNEGPLPQMIVGALLLVAGSMAVLAGWTLGGLVIYSGRSLARQRRWMFSLVVAALCCALAPIGTVLGVFTIVVLLRDSVKRLYGMQEQ